MMRADCYARLSQGQYKSNITCILRQSYRQKGKIISGPFTDEYSEGHFIDEYS